MNDAYVVAVRRDHRHDVPEDWADRLRAIEGVTVVGRTGHVAKVVAGDAAIADVRRVLGRFLHVEPEVRHRPC